MLTHCAVQTEHSQLRSKEIILASVFTACHERIWKENTLIIYYKWCKLYFKHDINDLIVVNDEICIPGYPNLLIFFPAVFLKLQCTRLFPAWWNIITCPYTLFLSGILSLLFVTVLFKLRTYSAYLSVVSKQKVTETSRHTHEQAGQKPL